MIDLGCVMPMVPSTDPIYEDRANPYIAFRKREPVRNIFML